MHKAENKTIEQLRAELSLFKKEGAPDMAKMLGKRIRAYIRISSNAVGNDEARQLFAVEEFQKRYECEVEIHVEKSSARGGRVRKVWRQLIADAKANKYDILWAEQPSRLGRNVLEGLVDIRSFQDAGVKVFIEKFGCLYDPKDIDTKHKLLNQFMVAEIESDWNSQNTRKSMKVKQNILKKWADDNGLGKITNGGGKKFSNMIIPDPLYKGDKNKKGICQVEIPYVEEIFTQHHMIGATNRELAETFRQPVSPTCRYGCWNGTEMPFKSMPRYHKSGDERRLYRKEVNEWINSGNWANYIKSDAQIQKDFVPLKDERGKPKELGPFETKKGTRAKRTCGCGQKMSPATVCTHIKRLVYDTGESEYRSPHAFERADKESVVMDSDELREYLMSGKVSSK